MKEFTRNNYTLIFFQKENDKKYSFYIKNEKELTEKLFISVKTKRVSENKIKYAVNGIFEILNNQNLLIKNSEIMNEKNPIIELAEKMQRIFGQNIETEVLTKEGQDHCPTVTVAIHLPNGKVYEASGSNKRIAKRKAAENALADFNS